MKNKIIILAFLLVAALFVGQKAQASYSCSINSTTYADQASCNSGCNFTQTQNCAQNCTVGSTYFCKDNYGGNNTVGPCNVGDNYISGDVPATYYNNVLGSGCANSAPAGSVKVGYACMSSSIEGPVVENYIEYYKMQTCTYACSIPGGSACNGSNQCSKTTAGTCTYIVPVVTYSWSSGAWGTCGGGSCGNNNGTHTRTVVCKDSNGNTVADSNCSGTKPTTSETCMMAACAYSWKNGAWGACNPSCGSGTQLRSVWCEDSSGYVVANSNCSGTAPADNQACNNGACTAAICLNVPANASVCPSDNLGLTDSTFSVLASTCSAPAGSAPKCQYTCNANYTLSGGMCKFSPTFNPTGSCVENLAKVEWAPAAGASSYFAAIYTGSYDPTFLINLVTSPYTKLGTTNTTYNWVAQAVDSNGKRSDLIFGPSFSCAATPTPPPPPACTAGCIDNPTACDASCGSGKKYCKYQNADCSITNNFPLPCSSPACPSSSDADRNWKEVAP
ncbi:MAG: thrombospondin type-1 domain-containing protein [Parcubacteria group bacterium]